MPDVRGEPFDMALDAWFPNYTDPADLLNHLFDGRSIRARETATTPTSTIPSTTANSLQLRGSLGRDAMPTTRRSKPTSFATPRRQHRS